MKITILGGGVTGLAAAWELSKKGHKITLLEKEHSLGGLAGGFKEKEWDWPLERAYHHIFSNDQDIQNLAEETGFNGLFFSSPKTASLYAGKGLNNYRIFPVDTPQDFLRLPLLSIPEKLRAGAVLAFLKLSPFLSLYEKQTAEVFLKKYMGEEVWDVLWQELFRKKFGKNAGNIIASFIWARINKRTKILGYSQGGFQAFVDHLARVDREKGVKILTGMAVKAIEKRGRRFEVGVEKGRGIESDAVLVTLPTPIFLRVGEGLNLKQYAERLSKIQYLHAVNLILEMEEPLFEKEYWLSVCDKNAPMMVLVQHTNFIDKKNYGGKHILYVANYVERASELFQAENEKVFKYHLPYLKKMSGSGKLKVSRKWVFKAPFAQPLFDMDYPSKKPTPETPVKNLFVANLDMTYPYDRGTNYAVKLGKDVAELINS